MWSVFIVFSILGLDLSSAQLVQFGQCNPNIQLVNNFDLEAFTGKWFGVGRTDSVLQSADCSTLELTATDDGIITIFNEAVNNNFREVITGNGTLEEGTARFTFNVSVLDDPIDFWILQTDYINFALGYACVNRGTVQRSVYIWQLGREPEYAFPLLPILMNQTLNNLLGISLNDLRPIQHSETACHILPDIAPGEPIILPGRCDQNITVLQDFNPVNFSGVWHNIASYYTTNQMGACQRAQYTLSGDVVNILNSEVINQTLRVITGSAVVSSTDGSAKLMVTIEAAPGVFSERELFVLGSDYENYAVSYSCEDLPNNQKRVSSWIVSRSRTLSPSSEDAVRAIINANLDLNQRFYIEIDQSDESCFYFPDPVPNQPVVFRGQCNLTIPAMPNFDAAEYLGRWHNIESYPSVWEGGNCSNAVYSLGDGVVDVLNTQVVNQGLDVMRGFAVVASVDNSAKLDVTFPVAGTNLTVTISYWVLDTDYRNYSLVYSCQNLNADEMQVWSWKLSRTRELTEESRTAIDRVIDTVSVLDERYYWTTDQSESGCFYFPEPQPGVPVVFPGQCDTSIPVVSNFNMSLFQGTWFEYQAYPKDQQTGQCITHRYSTGAGNTLSLVSSSVTDQFLDSTDGVLSFSGTDGSGRLTLTLQTAGGVVSFPFWILDVDYADYALAYSCVNIDEYFQGIYSWKLSRVQGTLSAAGNTAINNVLSRHVVLDQRYYEDIDHSADACFFLPDLAPGEPVILPGQCDRSIPVVQNFNASGYTGLWRLIESYPAEAQTGTCNDATYTLQGSTVIVFNTQVINQTLDTITGSAVLDNDDGNAKLLVTFPGTPVQAEYWVLDTDYDSYALVYSCVNLNANQRRVWSWKLSRTDELSDTAQANINRVVNSIQVLNNRFYEKIDRSDDACFYYPEADSGSPVIFRGQCDESIPVITDFNPVAYMNLWHDIQSYPTGFQGGTCPNAFYTLVDGEVDVFNTQVNNQTLDTINGVARLVSTANIAKLIVSFPIAGTNLTTSTDYWVLATDYNNYALVYSCVNLNDNRRRVNSWKLSRTKSLSTADNNNINAVMATIPVLRQQYYINRDQSPDGCFYFPEPQPGVPVVFPGQCDNNIRAVQNFNLTAFEGTWHEIEAYPKEQQPGQCVNHLYSLETGNSFNILSSGVLGLNQNLTNSIANLTSTDGTGRLTMTTPSGISPFPFWILDTDYTDYALAYSCVNIRDDFRAVYSWKLSRSRSLSAAANATLNDFIENSNIEVLGNRYFEDIDQSDEACFFLPDPVPGQPTVFPGQCDETIPVVQNFSAERYGGRWRLIESYPTFFQNGSCQEATYELNGTEVIVFNTQVIGLTLDTINGTATLASTDGSAKLEVIFPNSPEPASYWVLDTDYDSYALVYSCSNLGSDQRIVFSWKLSRTRSLTETAITNINRVVDTINVLDDRYYYNMDHSDDGCFYLPDPDPTRPVVFRGKCDQNISVVTNFDPVAYQRLWHDIESYPTRFQEGTCNNAYYTLIGDEVDVFNTQVIDQRLDTINAVARLASDDGSAKLLVTFPVAGTNLTVTTDYWVLATDYTSYALVYTCVDLDDDRRQVSSWKLSREKQLSATAQAAINAVVQQVPVLSDAYYITRDQTREGCFYFPEPVPGQPVQFPGQCENIQAKANFSFESFQGLWHEIESYPKEQQTGQCINHDFSQGSGNTWYLESSSVTNLQLNISRGNAAITSTDGTGRLTITITVDGTTIVIPFWVLETDYTDFALAYACVNINADFRGVYSWKLSRTRELSIAAVAAINETISTIDVLDERYYEKVDQSDEACFYLPELGPNDPVVFRGQCDENIPVVQNFDPVRYGNHWRMIETYYSDSQNGSCNDATYTLLPNSTVFVYNTQVNSQLLQSIEGTAVLATTDGSAKLLVTFPGTPEPAEYWVLDTDYDSYALVYSCRNLNNETRRVWSWKLSRTRELSEVAVTNISRIVDSINVLDDRYFQQIDHSDDACFYYPIPDGNPVSFRGQCDENIPVVTNFDIGRYMGSWYDIESYPQAFQDGTCPTAAYELSANGVDVFNTQVVEQELDTINAIAVPANASDTSAKFIVSFPIAGTDLVRDTPYWVLATDYTSYALVYACTNDGEDRRRVGSWKLSRTRNLTMNAINSINNVIETVPVLRQQYYNARGHSDDDCFYYPDNNGGPVILNGQCITDQDVVTNFTVSEFAGTWYEVSRFPSELQNGECTTTTLTVNDANTLILTQTIVYNERLVTVSGSVQVDPEGRGILTARLTGSGVIVEKILYVLSTDYTDHALIMSCSNLDNNRKQIYSWKFSRSQDGFSAVSGEAIEAIVNSNIDLFHRYYEETDQTNRGCFYYPVFTETPSTIILRGPCDDTITAKANFSAADYLGRWFEIARYPVTFQFGECARAEYIADVDAVRVLNSQVVNKKLDIMIGSAVVASDDGSGVLNVSFAFDNGVVNFANYYILETDYSNFALVYSCRNLENNTRQVSSWKLSRTNTLSNEANAIMDNIILRTQGLIEDYYLTTRQDEDACFYIPEVNRDEAPRFRGQCANVTGVQNFDPQRYAGWWHEIERYPSDIDVGDCISSDFRVVGNQFQIVDTNIFDVTAQVNTSTVVVSNDGRLTKTFSDGRVVELWILATDYETYSLLYSCENINDEYMRVWSAKHSKTRSLTESAQNAIAYVILNNRVLLQEFFITVDQSDEACFHYPVQTGTRIILPGQCDAYIPVMQAFSAAEYSGTWYQIERYPQTYENGSCTGARYTPNTNTDVIDVLNWQVIDDTLDKVEGSANITSTDRSARLRVSLPVRGTDDPNPPMVETELWILTTDYIRYSLAYSCVNINEFQRAVGAWKLSRTRTMSAAGNTAINNFMATRQELHQPFFLQVEQSDDCLGPNSAILFQSSIIIMLICAMLQVLV